MRIHDIIKKQHQPSIVFITTDYDAFLAEHYNSHPDLTYAGYAEQLNSLYATRFGDADFYSAGLTQNGWETLDIIANNAHSQNAWLLAHGKNSEKENALLSQIKSINPDVVYFHNIGLLNKDFHSQIRAYTRLIVGQIACPVPERAYLHGFDIIFSSFPHFVTSFRAMGICSYYQPLAFDSRILSDIGPRSIKHPFTFVGGISRDHSSGTALLEQIAEQTPLEIWGYGSESLTPGSLLHSRHQGPVWGLDMFRTLRSSGITLNRHIDVAGNFANNMRLFEATGCGALLVTDFKENLGELFEIGKEVVAYKTPEECVELIRYYLDHPEEAELIARNGQKRTLTEHSYTLRMKSTSEILSRHLRYQEKSLSIQSPDLAHISTGYRSIQANQVEQSMLDGWKDPAIPQKQRALVQEQLKQMYSGQVVEPYQVLAEALRPYIRRNDTLLEIGCSSGYYCEVIEYLLSKPICYTGADYSEPLIAMAREYYPERLFDVADGADLPYDDESFQCVVSGCVLLHVPDYKTHIKETIRVAAQYIIAHRTPVCKKRETHYQKKLAYGVETVELSFNNNEFTGEFEKNGAKLIGFIEFYSNPSQDEYQVTYIFQKNPQPILEIN